MWSIRKALKTNSPVGSILGALTGNFAPPIVVGAVSIRRALELRTVRHFELVVVVPAGQDMIAPSMLARFQTIINQAREIYWGQAEIGLCRVELWIPPDSFFAALGAVGASAVFLKPTAGVICSMVQANGVLAAMQQVQAAPNTPMPVGKQLVMFARSLFTAGYSLYGSLVAIVSETGGVQGQVELTPSIIQVLAPCDGLTPIAPDKAIGNTLAHELGHNFGLDHVEGFLGLPAFNSPEPCDANCFATNLMNGGGTAITTKLLGWQKKKLHFSPLLRDPIDLNAY